MQNSTLHPACRHSGQTALLAAGEKEFWRASHVDMAKAVVEAQSEMSRRQASDDWIVSGLRRNGLLAYRPDFSKQTLVPLLDSECCGTSMGRSALLDGSASMYVILLL